MRKKKEARAVRDDSKQELSVNKSSYTRNVSEEKKYKSYIPDLLKGRSIKIKLY